MPIKNLITHFDIAATSKRLLPLVKRTPLTFHKRLSEKYDCRLYLKREDLQDVRSYKIRGAFNKIITLPEDTREKGVVCASAGNHAQGVASTCNYLQLRGSIFMPVNTPVQKIERVRNIGGKYIDIFLVGEQYDDTAIAAETFSQRHGAILIPPFDDERIIEGQATVGLEIIEDLKNIDYLFMPVGGGGLAAGVGLYFKQHSFDTKLIGIEPAGAPSMSAAFKARKPVCLDKIDGFVDGAAVRQAGALTYSICSKVLDEMQTVPEGKICATVLSLYNDDGILAEPAGALALAALDKNSELIKGKTVVCILSGSNNDSNRMDEIKKLANLYEGLQHHLIIRFHHNPDGLKTFFCNILGDENFVNRIEYMRRDHGRSTYALLGIRSNTEGAYHSLITRLKAEDTEFSEVGKEDFLFKYWV